MMTVITGGSASGKSKYAENLAMSLGVRKRYYVATMIAWDEECRLRISRHQQMREKKQFHTIECFTDLKNLVIPQGDLKNLVLLECMSNLTANEIYRQNKHSQVSDYIIEGIGSLKAQAEDLIVVTNEVFSDGAEYGEETMKYLEILGTVNRRLAGLADRTVEVVYGIPVVTKGSSVV